MPNANNEALFVVDENNVPLAPHQRGEAIAAGLWRRTSGGIVLDGRRGVVLCHKRAANKDERPGVWVATFGGKTAPGEDPEGTATRELAEEFGIFVKRERLKFLGCLKSIERRQFEYSFLVDVDGSNTAIIPNDKEVAEFKWLDDASVVDRLTNDSGWFSYGFEIASLTAARE